MMRGLARAVTLVAAAVFAAPVAAQELGAARRQPSAEADNGGSPRMLVKLRANAARGLGAGDTLRSVAARAGVRTSGVRTVGGRLHVLEIEDSESRDEALARFRADPDVEYVEIDRRRYAHAMPNDPLYPGQWYLQTLNRAPSALDAETGWDVTRGTEGVVVAVLDTGVLFDHPDLLTAAAGGRLLPGYDFVASGAAANDGDGRDANASDPGDWVSAADAAAPPFRGCTPTGSSWHGTRVAGIIAARANNAVGLAGITWSPWVLPVRVLGKCGGFDSDILAGLRWAGGLHVDGVPDNSYPAKVVNVSLGSTDPCPASYADVIAELAAAGTLVVASAGNEGGPVGAPANCPGVAAVAGLRHVGTKVGYSSLGSEIALSAPAGNCVNSSGACLYSIDTTSNAGDTTPSTHVYTDQLDFTVGTSFSAPIVAGVAALMISVNGNLTPAQTIARLAEGATTPFPTSTDSSVPMCRVPRSQTDIQPTECNCTTDTCGAGIANLPGALEAALRPIASVAVTGTFAPGSDIEVSAAGSAAACGHAIASYEWVSLDSNGPGITGTDPAVAVVVAPATDAYRLRLTVTDDAGRQDRADVTVTPTELLTSAPTAAGAAACLPPVVSPSISVTVTPHESNVDAGATQTFTAAVANAVDAGVTWHVAGVAGGSAEVGTITAQGEYTAPAIVPSPPTVVVSAVSNEDPTRLDNATVTVVAPATPPQTPASSGGGAIDLLLAALLLAPLLARRLQQRQQRADFSQSQSGVETS